MALGKRNSRPITVDGESYRYCVSIGASDPAGNFPLNITVQSVNGVGAKLCVLGMTTRDFWLDMPNVLAEESGQSAYKTVLPRHVSSWIQKAILDGWNPTIGGAPFLLTTDGDVSTTEN